MNVIVNAPDTETAKNLTQEAIDAAAESIQPNEEGSGVQSASIGEVEAV